MYYLAEIRITRVYGNRVVEELTRLVKAKDKNEAWDKSKQYLDLVYIHDTEHLVAYTIQIHDTII